MAVGKDCDDKNSKRSKNYADMPQLVVADTYIVFGCCIYFINYIYNETWSNLETVAREKDTIHLVKPIAFVITT